MDKLYTFGIDSGVTPVMPNITTTGSTTGSAPYYTYGTTIVPSGVGYSGLSMTTSFWPPVKIRFGFTLKLKRVKATIEKHWPSDIDYFTVTGKFGEEKELKKLL